MPLFSLVLALFAPRAFAFCGTYAASAGGAVVNHASQVVVATDGTTTTLTLANDFSGDTASFGLVIPLDGSVTAADITVTTRDALDVLDTYTAPRLVSYTCADVIWVPGESGGWEDYSPDGSGGGCGGGYSSPSLGYDSGSAGYESGGGLGTSEYAGGVTAEHFTAGEYALDLVSADQPGALQGWLDDNGFVLPEGAGAVLGEAVTAGATVLVARVAAEAEVGEDTWLSPIQVRYSGSEVSLPIRLGATASEGEQDILVYGISRDDQGALAVANYPRFDVDSHCMLATDDLASGYDAAFTAAYAAADRGGRAGWALEFLSKQGVCDPLPPSGPIESSVLADLGFGAGVENSTLSRLHLRGTAAEIDQDLVLYASGVNTYWQQDYIAQADHMDAYFRVCGESAVAGDDACPEPDYDPPSADTDDIPSGLRDTGSASTKPGCGGPCAGGLALPLAVLAAGSIRRRRR